MWATYWGQLLFSRDNFPPFAMASPPQSWAATAPGNHAEANDSADAPGTRELGWSSCHLKYLKLLPHHFGALVSSCIILYDLESVYQEQPLSANLLALLGLEVFESRLGWTVWLEGGPCHLRQSQCHNCGGQGKSFQTKQEREAGKVNLWKTNIPKLWKGYSILWTYGIL